MSFPKVLLSLTLIAALAACGGGKSQSNASDSSNGAGMTGATASPADEATPQGGAAAGNGGSMAAQGASAGSMGAAAAVPSNVNCGAVQPVWVNERTHVYHTSTDPVYGRTKHGMYMCPDAAVAAGYHKAGGHYNGRHRGSMSGEMASPAPDAT